MSAPQAARLRAVAGFVPQGRLSNAVLAEEHPDWDMARLGSKIGIVERRIAEPGETAGDLAAAAARRLFAATGTSGSDFDYLLFCTQSPDYFLPATACVLQHRLSLPVTAGALDFNQGCSGYVYGLQLAKALVSGGAARNVLLLTGETYSRYIDPNDRTVRPIFGDGASASWIHGGPEGAELGAIRVGTDGSGSERLIVRSGGARSVRGSESELRAESRGAGADRDRLYMDGREVFNFTLDRVPPLINEILDAASLRSEDVHWVVLHQANRFMNEHLRRKLGFPESRVPERLSDVGNTVSATIPLVLTAHGGSMRPGDSVLLVGFGVGYSWGAALLTWGAGVTLADA